MLKNKLRILYKKNPQLNIPEYQTQGAAGADISAFLEDAITILPGDFQAIPTGLFLEIPVGFEVQIRPRSGLAFKFGVTVLNSPGTIDSDYRGEVKVLLINHGKEPFLIRNGDRIAQMIVSPVLQVSFESKDILDETKRNGGGFGSTGIA
ncbi:MAG: dUTP diphosphatase [Spirochaetota bacterium]|jgi:dUTP pyrophosphatase|nr:dUTP diphosphatase [Spirochaetota bacterium]